MLGNYKRPDDIQFYFVGGGLGSLAGACYLLRDCGFEGKNIHVIEALPVCGGSNDAKGDADHGWVCRGERMFDRMTYEDFWDICRSIPSLTTPDTSIADEMISFSIEKPTYARARLLDKTGEIMDVSSYGLNQKELMQVFSLLKADESELDDLTIEDWFGEKAGDGEHFFHTVFWYCYEATFAFQPWSSVMEYRRYLTRLFHLIIDLTGMHGLTLTVYNQYESIIKPMMAVLEEAGVQFTYNTAVTDMDFAEGDGITITALHTLCDGKEGIIEIRPQDRVVTTLGCMTDNSSEGDTDRPAVFDKSYPISARLWKNIAAKKAGLGNPDKFFAHPDQSAWMTFNCTFRGHTFEKWFEAYTHSKTGRGFSSTMVEHPWHMEFRSPLPPFFSNQDTDEYSFLWMCAFYSAEPGTHCGKPEFECTGMEILDEILLSLPMDDATRDQVRSEVVHAIPVILPYTDAHFLPRAAGDRPEVVPAGSTNAAFIGQYVEIPEDIVFTENYSVRGARMAVYQLLGMDKQPCQITPLRFDVRVLMAALVNYLK